MTNFKYCVAACVSVAFAIVSFCTYAQDDLDNLLKDLEGEVTAEKKAEKKVEEKKAEPEAKAEEKAAEPEAKAEEKAEEKPAAAVEEKVAEKAEEKKVETKAEEKAEEKSSAAAEEKVAEKAEEKAAEPEAKAEEKAEEKPAAAEEKVAEKADEKPAAPKSAESKTKKDAELIENLRATESLRRRALDVQALREITDARKCMEEEEYDEAVRHYGLAVKLLNDRSGSKDLRRECDQGIAEGLFRAAMQEDTLGRRERAIKLMEKAMDMRHPKARRFLEHWNAEDDPDADRVDVSEIKHRMNDEDYKLKREQIRKHLKRSRQYLAVKDMKKALEECEVVLVSDPYNREALRIRKAIQLKRKTILKQEREASRDGMIADVDEAWRPVYAVNAAQLKNASAETVKTQAGDDPERTQEQEIEKRMKEMMLPTISFKPPATVIEAVEWFISASKDYDRPDRPVEQRGFNFVLKAHPGAAAAKAKEGEAESSDDFSSNGEGGDDAATSGYPQIPTINANNISLYDALKLVCDSVDYKFIVRGPVVMVMQKDMSTAEILSRKYNVPEAFMERVSSASEEIKTMGGFGSNNSNSKKSDEGEENQERDWKAFFEEMGVKWPEGSSIKHVKSLGKLYVRNTRENLAEFEKVLDELGGQPQLIEIETRFVEVEQDDLNSLGFEWILNSDYSLDVGDKVGKALGIGNSSFGTKSGTQTWTSSVSGSGSESAYQDSLTSGGTTSTLTGGSKRMDTGSSTTYSDTRSMTIPSKTQGGTLVDNALGGRNLGFNAFGGTDSNYGNGNRYLSDVGNHISGEDSSNNDQFMRVNAFLGEADLSMILHMLSQRSDTDLLSAPKVVTKSGEQAVIKVVTEYIYPQDYDVQLSQSSGNSSSSSSSGNSSMSIAIVEPQNFTMREVGVILDVTPTYSEANGGTIDLELKPSVVDEPVWHNYGMKIPITGNPTSMPGIGWITELGDDVTTTFANAVKQLVNDNANTIAASYVDAGISSMKSSSLEYYDAPMEQPFFHVRSIDSKVSITPGSTVVMGGLITESRKAMDDKVPFLGDLPFIGRLFRSHAERTTKRNLLIFVTGRLITPSGRELSVNEESSAEEAAVKPAPKAE